MSSSPGNAPPPDRLAASPSGGRFLRPFRRWLFLLAGLFLLFLVWTGYRGWMPGPSPRPEDEGEPVPPDPRLTYSGPFLNVRPEVSYVGDAVCTGCHPLVAETFRDHPMGRSIVPARRAAAEKLYDRPVVVDALHSRFILERRDERLWHRRLLRGPKGETLGETEAEVHFVVGSGRRGHSYFTVQEGRLFQTPLSWYAQKEKWDASPGFPDGHLREIPGTCVFCHSGGARPVEHTANRYETPVLPAPAIGCERCHGPGELHVRSRERDELPKGRFDPTIVNPRHLEPDLREQVCQQCHLEGEARIPRRGRSLFDYRPGLPLDDFWITYVHAGGREGARAVSHVEQMYESKCFQASAGRMGCVSCHDPHQHVRPEERLAHYRARCLACHEPGARAPGSAPMCVLDQRARREQSRLDSCMDCHMPRFVTTDIVHTAATDHRILRAPNQKRAGAARPASRFPLVAWKELPRALGSDAARPRAPESHPRELGLALLRVAAHEHLSADQLLTVLELIETALIDSPRDLLLLVGRGQCLQLLQRQEQALDALEQVLAIEPREELALGEATLLSLRFDRIDRALDYCRRSLDLNSLRPTNHLTLALILVRKRDWRGAQQAAAAALRLDPSLVTAHVILSRCHERLGDRARAEEEMRKARGIPGQDVAEIERSLGSFFR